MPEWLENRNPKLARMFEHIVEDCKNRDKGDWDLPNGVENCYEYAMGHIKKEPEFKKAIMKTTKSKQGVKKASKQSGGTEIDYYALGLTMLSNIKKDLITLETDVMIQNEELEDLRYLGLVGTPEQSQGIPRVIEAYNALQEVQKHLALAINTIDQAKRNFRGESSGRN